jgi:hypothetical protein
MRKEGNWAMVYALRLAANLVSLVLLGACARYERFQPPPDE